MSDSLDTKPTFLLESPPDGAAALSLLFVGGSRACPLDLSHPVVKVENGGLLGSGDLLFVFALLVLLSFDLGVSFLVPFGSDGLLVVVDVFLVVVVPVDDTVVFFGWSSITGSGTYNCCEIVTDIIHFQCNNSYVMTCDKELLKNFGSLLPSLRRPKLN